MQVEIYITTDPEFPGRAFVAAWPPSPERLRALRARGADVHLVVTSVPPPPLLPAVSERAHKLDYLGRTVRRVSLTHPDITRRGRVSYENAETVVVDWPEGAGTFARARFEEALTDGILSLEDDDGQQKTDPSPTDP